MKIAKRLLILTGLVGLTFAGAIAARQSFSSASGKAQNDMPGMDMSGANQDDNAMREAGKSANDVMSDHDMHMGTHMFMTDLRPHSAADDERAAQIVEALRKSIAKYSDYKVALADGFRIFMPELPQPLYHFTNYGYGYMAEFKFDPALPTSLLYKKTAEGYTLIGAMYTAPKNYTLDQLDARVPLSVARWHKHVNLCLPQKGIPIRDVNWQQFGFTGSIASEDACSQAGGRWIPEIFNWMVHVYPYETESSKVWAH